MAAIDRLESGFHIVNILLVVHVCLTESCGCRDGDDVIVKERVVKDLGLAMHYLCKEVGTARRIRGPSCSLERDRVLQRYKSGCLLPGPVSGVDSASATACLHQNSNQLLRGTSVKFSSIRAA